MQDRVDSDGWMRMGTGPWIRRGRAPGAGYGRAVGGRRVGPQGKPKEKKEKKRACQPHLGEVVVTVHQSIFMPHTKKSDASAPAPDGQATVQPKQERSPGHRDHPRIKSKTATMRWTKVPTMMIPLQIKYRVCC